MRVAGASACGSTVPSQGAKIAARAISARSRPPSVIVGLRLTKVAKGPECRGAAMMGGSSGAAASAKGAWA